MTDAARQFTLMREFASISVIMSKSKTIRKMGCFSLLEYIFPINSTLAAAAHTHTHTESHTHNKNWKKLILTRYEQSVQ